MAFLETPRFPDKISMGAVGGPSFNTTITFVEGGDEFRNANWSQERGMWEVSHAARTVDQFRTLQHFFRAVRGRYMGFRFKDWFDFEVSEAQGILVEVTAGTTYQLYKRYAAGATTYDRKITKPVAASVVIIGGSGHSLDATTGILTKGTGTPTAWSGEFDVPCRFDVDKMDGEYLDNKHGERDMIAGWSSIPIVETRDIA